MKIEPDINRVKNVIENDRLSITKNYTSLISYDIEELLMQYFELRKCVDLEVFTNDYGYDIVIKAKATHLKPFKIVPKENKII